MEEKGGVPRYRLVCATAAASSGMSKAILVTGGAGNVGSHACKALAQAGYRPVVYDNLSRGHARAVRWGPLVEGDLHDRATLVAALRSHGIAPVMRFAALAYVGESVGEPELATALAWETRTAGASTAGS
jgi:nucleoside-diphosphate-sugar epimerase